MVEAPSSGPVEAAQPHAVLLSSSSWGRRTMSKALGGAFAVGTAPDVESALGMVPAGCEAVVIVVSTALPALGPVVRRLCRARPLSAVVLHGPAPDEDVLLGALRDGCRGWLPDGMEPDALVRALQAVARGELAVPRTVTERLVAKLRPDGESTAALSRLTPKQREVARLLGEGRSTEQIARDLFVSSVTVRTHIAAVVRSLGVADRVEAVRLLSR